MGDPLVREIGRVEDIDGEVVIVGIGHGMVTLCRPDCAVPQWELPVETADELAAMLITACWQAASQRLLEIPATEKGTLE